MEFRAVLAEAIEAVEIETEGMQEKEACRKRIIQNPMM
jgi:hypothetical protein